MIPWIVAHQAPLSMGILQARILEWVAIPSSRGSSQPRNWTQVSCIAGGFFTIYATRKAMNHYWLKPLCFGMVWDRARTSQVTLVVKNLPSNAGDVRDTGSIPGLGRSPAQGHDNPLQCSWWRIPWTEKPGGLESIVWQRIGHDWSCACTLHARTHLTE